MLRARSMSTSALSGAAAVDQQVDTRLVSTAGAGAVLADLDHRAGADHALTDFGHALMCRSSGTARTDVRPPS